VSEQLPFAPTVSVRRVAAHLKRLNVRLPPVVALAPTHRVLCVVGLLALLLLLLLVFVVVFVLPRLVRAARGGGGDRAATVVAWKRDGGQWSPPCEQRSNLCAVSYSLRVVGSGLPSSCGGTLTAYSDEKVANIVTLGISVGRSLTGPFRDARRFPST
jgi:hypothetical protein